MKIVWWDNTVVVVSAAVYGAILGFACGNTVAFDIGFKLWEWQTLISALVALAAAATALMMTRQTQRITVLIKEQERIDRRLVGLQQVAKLVSGIADDLRDRSPEDYLTKELDSVLPPAETFRDRFLGADDETLLRLREMGALLRRAKECGERISSYYEWERMEQAWLEQAPKERRDELSRELEKKIEAQQRAISTERDEVAFCINFFRVQARYLVERAKQLDKRRRAIESHLDRYFN